MSQKRDEALNEMWNVALGEWLGSAGRPAWNRFRDEHPEGFTTEEFDAWMKTPEIDVPFRAYAVTRYEESLERLIAEGRVVQDGEYLRVAR